MVSAYLDLWATSLSSQSEGALPHTLPLERISPHRCLLGPPLSGTVVQQKSTPSLYQPAKLTCLWTKHGWVFALLLSQAKGRPSVS